MSLLNPAKRKRIASEVDPVGAGIDPAPYSQLGRVTYNARVDDFSVMERLALGATGTYYNRARVDERVFDMVMPDLLLQRVGDVEQFRTGGQVGFHPVVFSSMNALREDASLPKHRIVEKYRLAGVAQGGVKFNQEGRPNSEFIAVTVGGTQSLINNSKEQIMAGDEVWWDVPDRDANGEAIGYTPRKDDPRGKIPAVIIKRYRPDVHGPAARSWLTDPTVTESLLDRRERDKGGHIAHVFDCIVRMAAMGSVIAAAGETVDYARAVTLTTTRQFRLDMLAFLLNSKDINTGDVAFKEMYGNFLNDIMECFAEHLNFISSRKFARAKTNATPGHLVDVVLGTYRLS